MTHILIIDDDKFLATMLKQALEKNTKHYIEAVFGTHDAFPLLQENTYDLVVTDMRMPGLNGFDVIDYLKQAQPDCRIIAMSAGSKTLDSDTTLFAVSQQADKTLSKPFEVDTLLGAINELVS